MSLFGELKRRNVFRVAAAYVVLSWLLLQVADLLMDLLELPDTWGKAIFGLLVIGIVPVVVFSWVYEMTPEGLKRESEVNREASITTETGNKLNITIVFLLIVAIGVYSVDNFILDERQHPVPATVDARDDETGETSLPVVAVLPLQALSTQEEGQFLAAGLHDDLLTRLARLQAFRVISRTSVMEYAGTTKNMREIGAELGAGFILEGGLQAMGGNVRINAQLIDASTDEHLWAETFDRELTTANLFDVQGELAAAIAEAAHAALSPQEVEQMGSAPTENLAAYEAYLRGKANSGILTQPAIEATVGSFGDAVDLDPNYAEAWAWLALSLARKYWETGAEDGIGADDSLREAALEALKQAQALAPGGVMTLVAESYYHYYGFRDYARALEIAGRASAIAPNDIDVNALRSYLFRRLGRMSESADQMIANLQLDPNSPTRMVQTGLTLVDAHRCTEARRYSNVLQDRHPDDVQADALAAIVSAHCDKDFAAAREYILQVPVTTFQQLGYVVWFLVLAEDYDGAIKAAVEARETLGEQATVLLWIENWLARLYQQTGQDVLAEAALQNAIDVASTIDDPGATALLEFVGTAAIQGDAEETQARGEHLLASLPDDAYRYPDFAVPLAAMYVGVGLLEEAVELLVETSANFTFEQEMLYEQIPAFEPLHDDPRFQAMVANVVVY